MSREKLLWGACGAAVAAAATSALLLTFPMQPSHNGPDPSLSANPGSFPTPPSSSVESDPVARVGNVELSREQYLRDLEGLYGDQYIREWMERTAVRLEAQALGIDVQHDEIGRELERMQRGYDSEEQFYLTMEEQLGMTKEELRADVLFRLQLEKIAIKGVSVSDADVDKYISEHPEEFEPMRELRFAQIVVDSEAEAEEVLARLGEGYDFELLARDMSVDAETAADGGDLGWVAADDPFIPAELMEAADKLPVGGISSPIPLEDGRFAVITKLGKRETRPDNDAEIRESLRRELALSKAPPTNDVLDQLLEKWGAQTTM